MPDAAPDAAAPAAAPAVSAPAATEAVAPAAASVKAPEAAGKAPPADVKVDPAPPAKMFKVKVDGQELEVSEEDLLRGYQTRHAADKRFKEAAEAKKSAESKYAEMNTVLELMASNPQKFAEKARALGIDPAKLAQEILLPLMQAEIDAETEKTMSPEQLKARQTEKELAGYKQREVEAKKAAEAAEKQKVAAAEAAQVSKYQEEYSAIILDALKETSLPQTEHTGIELAELLLESIERGLSVDAKTLARDLESRTWEKLNIMAKKSAAEKGKADFIDADVRKMIRKEAMDDPEIREAIRKASVEEYKKANPMAAPKPVTGNSRVASKATKTKTWGATMRELQLGKL